MMIRNRLLATPDDIRKIFLAEIRFDALKYIAFAFVCFLISCTSKTVQLDQSIHQVVTAFTEHDSTAINQMIHPDVGLHILYRSGVFPVFENIHTIDFSRPVALSFSYLAIKSTAEIQHANLPTFNCATNQWNKTGLFVDTTDTSHLLSETARQLNEYLDKGIPQDSIRFFHDLEARSERVVLVDEGGDLVFYLSRINQKWYLTILDRLTSDCNA